MDRHARETEEKINSSILFVTGSKKELKSVVPPARKGKESRQHRKQHGKAPPKTMSSFAECPVMKAATCQAPLPGNGQQTQQDESENKLSPNGGRPKKTPSSSSPQAKARTTFDSPPRRSE